MMDLGKICDVILLELAWIASSRRRMEVKLVPLSREVFVRTAAILGAGIILQHATDQGAIARFFGLEERAN